MAEESIPVPTVPPAEPSPPLVLQPEAPSTLAGWAALMHAVEVTIPADLRQAATLGHRTDALLSRS